MSNHKGLSITHPCFQLPDPNNDITMGDKILKGKGGIQRGEWWESGQYELGENVNLLI